MTNKRTVEDLAESIAYADGECVFLIGAGFSFSAGIPLAGELVGEIKGKFPRAYHRSNTKEYNCVMGELTPHQRAQLLTGYIDEAKVNWAHLALAQLFEADKIDRILTVNFDPLVLKACSMVGEFPAVYDLATASEFKESRISPKSVFYLNGQHTGFAMLNSDNELNKHRARLHDIVRNTGTGRLWVVVGYSGEADPLAEVLIEIAQSSGFDNGLYWIGHSDSPTNSQKKLLSNENTFFIGGQDADDFMQNVGRKLKCFPPVLLTDPISHIDTIITDNINFSTGGPVGEQVYEQLKTIIGLAKSASKEADGSLSSIPDLANLLLAGKYSEIFEHWNGCAEKFTARQRSIVAWAYVMAANDSSGKARIIQTKELSKSISLWSEAGTNYQQALEIKPDMHEAFNNWGLALDQQAQALANSDLKLAQSLWSEAYGKYEQALSIKSDDLEALNNWGLALDQQAQVIASSDLELAQQLWSEAYGKYQQVLMIKPDKHWTLNNWGNALHQQAQVIVSSDPKRAIELWSEAGEKYAQALTIKPDKHEALSNLGVALSNQAKAIVSSDLERALELWSEANGKYEQALKIKPDMHEALSNWTAGLIQNYLAIRDTQLDESLKLLKKATELLKGRIKLAPGIFAYNYACLWALKSDPKQSVHWLKVAKEHQKLPSKHHIDEDKDFDSIRDSQVFIDWYDSEFGNPVDS